MPDLGEKVSGLVEPDGVRGQLPQQRAAVVGFLCLCSDFTSRLLTPKFSALGSGRFHPLLLTGASFLPEQWTRAQWEA